MNKRRHMGGPSEKLRKKEVGGGENLRKKEVGEGGETGENLRMKEVVHIIGAKIAKIPKFSPLADARDPFYVVI